MGRKFVISALSVMMLFTALFSSVDGFNKPFSERKDIAVLCRGVEYPVSEADTEAVYTHMSKMYKSGTECKGGASDIGIRMGDYYFYMAADLCPWMGCYYTNDEYVYTYGWYEEDYNSQDEILNIINKYIEANKTNEVSL